MIISPYVHPSPPIPVVPTAMQPLAVSTTMTTRTNGETKFSNDNISVNTTHANNTTITNPTDASEYVLKFQFCPKNKKNNTDVAYTHYTLSYKPFVITFPKLQSVTTMTEPWTILHHQNLCCISSRLQSTSCP